MLAYCRRHLASTEDAEDAVQTTFVHALRSLRSGVKPQFEAPWLFAIARNVCRDRWRIAGRNGALESRHAVEELSDTLAAPAVGDDLLLDLDSALSRMVDRQRHALLLREWRGFSYAEIATELSISESAVETLLHRARRSLANELEHGRNGSRRSVARTLTTLLAFPRKFWKAGAGAKLAAGTAAVSVAVVAGGVELQPAPTHAAQPKGTHAAQTAVVTQDAAATVHVPRAAAPHTIARHATRHTGRPSTATVPHTRPASNGAGVASTPAATPAAVAPAADPTQTEASAPPSTTPTSTDPPAAAPKGTAPAPPPADPPAAQATVAVSTPSVTVPPVKVQTPAIDLPGALPDVPSVTVQTPPVQVTPPTATVQVTAPPAQSTDPLPSATVTVTPPSTSVLPVQLPPVTIHLP